MTRLELLEDTVNWFSANPNRRCINPDRRCCYSPQSLPNNSKTTGCAIGRHLSPELALYLDENYTNNSSVSEVFHNLPEDLQILGVDFLLNVQDLHDTDAYWGKNGLTEAGQRYVNKIKEEFCQ